MITNKEANFVSAVIYVNNDEEQISSFLCMLYSVFSENFKSHEIIVVNDKSTDNSVVKVRAFASQYHNATISILNMSYRQGLERAMKAGIELAIGDFIYEFDTINVDYSPETIIEIYRESIQGYDIVCASSIVGTPLMSRLFYALMNRNSNMQYVIGSETFRILSRRAINRAHSISHTIPYRKAIYANCGLKVKCYKYEVLKNAPKFNSQLPTGEKIELAMSSLILFTNIAYKVTLILAIAMTMFAFGVAIYAVLFYLMETPVQGWTTTILFLSFAFGGLFIILAMVIKYLSTIVSLNFVKKDYIFESIEKL